MQEHRRRPPKVAALLQKRRFASVVPLLLLSLFNTTALQHDRIAATELNDDSIDAQIINGSPVASCPGFAVPHGYLDGLNGLCGGVLIHNDIILTAAHCHSFWENESIFVGATLLDGSDALAVARGLQEYVHPEFFHATQSDVFRCENDIMLVKLDEVLNTTEIPLLVWNSDPHVPHDGNNTDKDYIILGFGASMRLLEARVPAINEASCREFYKSPPYFPDNMICAGTPSTTTCSGDSGGPLIHAETGRVVGLVSFGKSSCDRPTVFTRISIFDAWIRHGICGLSAIPPLDCQLPVDWPAISDWEPNRDDNVAQKNDYCGGRYECKSWLLGRAGHSYFWPVWFPLLGGICFNRCVTFLPTVALALGWQCGSCPER